MNRRDFLRNAVQGLAGLAGLVVARVLPAKAERKAEIGVPPDIKALHLLEDLEFLTGAGVGQPLGVINNGVENGGYLVPPEIKDQLLQWETNGQGVLSARKSIPLVSDELVADSIVSLDELIRGARVEAQRAAEKLDQAMLANS